MLYSMTKYAKQERAKVYEAYLKYFYDNTQKNFENYVKVRDNFRSRFHREYDPLNLDDDWDTFGFTLSRKVGKPFIPLELRNK